MCIFVFVVYEILLKINENMDHMFVAKVSRGPQSLLPPTCISMPEESTYGDLFQEIAEKHLTNYNLDIPENTDVEIFNPANPSETVVAMKVS